jgi:hypothetical protein
MKTIQLINTFGMKYLVSEIDEELQVTFGNKSIFLENISFSDFVSRWNNWVNGVLIQNAFPMLDADKREFLMTGITAEEWTELFADDEDGDGWNEEID